MSTGIGDLVQNDPARAVDRRRWWPVGRSVRPAPPVPLIGLGLFTVASLACGLATSQEFLIGARAVQGLGGTIVAVVLLSLIMTRFTEPADRAKAMGVIGFVNARRLRDHDREPGRLDRGADRWAAARRCGCSGCAASPPPT